VLQKIIEIPLDCRGYDEPADLRRQFALVLAVSHFDYRLNLVFDRRAENFPDLLEFT
jgi:hypothetical protein